MTEIKNSSPAMSKARRTLLPGMLLTIGLGVGIFFLVRGCSQNISPEAANVALKTEGKTYIYSSLGSTIVSSNIDAKTSPAILPSLEVYKDDDEFYVAPDRMKPFIDVLAGNTKLFDYKEQSYDGYVTSAEAPAYAISSSFRSTDRIGEQVTVYRASIMKTDGTEMLINWEFNPRSGEYKALDNCEVKSFWIETSPSPGETVISSKDYLVINIQKLASFFSRKAYYDRETLLLYVE